MTPHTNFKHLQFVPEHLKTKELCMLAIAKDGSLTQADLPESLRILEMKETENDAAPVPASAEE